MDLKLLKGKDFLLLMLGRFISLTGTQMQDFALSLYVLKNTGSAVLFSTVLIAALIPQLLLSPAAGVFADWLDRKKIIVYLDILSGMVVGSFAVIYMVKGQLSLINIYVLVILITLSSLLYQPAIGTIIPSIMKKEDLVNANGINSFIMNAANLLAPLIAGVLFGFYGIFVILVINAASFIISSIGETFINIPKTNKMPDKVNFKAFYNDFSEGIKFIKQRKVLLYIIILAPILNFVFSPLSSTAIAYVSKNILKVSDFQYGLLQMTIVAAMMISPFVMSKFGQKFTLGRILFWDILATSLLIAIMAIIPLKSYLNLFESNLVPLISITVIFSLVSAIITTANIALSVMFQKIVPITMMGRVGTVMNTGCMAMAPLGLLVFGILFDNISSWICILMCSLILFVTILSFRKALLSSDEISPV